MFKKILFATSATPVCDDAARVAFDMAQRYDAEITVFHVLGVPTRGFSQVVVDVRTGEEVAVDDEYIAWVKEEINTTYERQLAKCSKVNIEVVVGIPHREILRAARSEDVDLVVMGGSGRGDGSNYRHNTTGSTLQKVAKAARCPVMTISRAAASFWGGFSNIVFGTDFSKASDSAFKFALNTAKKLDAELNIFHCFDISSAQSLIKSQDQIEEAMLEARRKMRAKYVPEMGDFARYDIEVWEGTPYVEIVKFAREKGADLIVMAHHTSERDPEKAWLGSTMEQVILRATSPVVSVNHPDKVDV